MKIVVSAQGPEFESSVDPRFGRCQYFAFVELDDMTSEIVPNRNLNQSSGVGIRSAQFVCDQGVEAILTGNVGPKAQQVLSTAGVAVVTGVSGTVRDVVEAYKAGRLKSQGGTSGKPDKEGQEVRSWQDTPMSVGDVGGMRNKSGRGMGKCRGSSPGCAGSSPVEEGPDPSISQLRAEVEGLRKQVRYLEQQIDEVQKARP